MSVSQFVKFRFIELFTQLKKKIMLFLVATNVIASRLPEHRPTGTPHARANWSLLILQHDLSPTPNCLVLDMGGYYWLLVGSVRLVLFSIFYYFLSCIKHNTLGRNIHAVINYCHTVIQYSILGMIISVEECLTNYDRTTKQMTIVYSSLIF